MDNPKSPYVLPSFPLEQISEPQSDSASAAAGLWNRKAVESGVFRETLAGNLGRPPARKRMVPYLSEALLCLRRDLCRLDCQAHCLAAYYERQGNVAQTAYYASVSRAVGDMEPLWEVTSFSIPRDDWGMMDTWRTVYRVFDDVRGDVDKKKVALQYSMTMVQSQIKALKDQMTPFEFGPFVLINRAIDTISGRPATVRVRRA